jgi:hypothetical protein
MDLKRVVEVTILDLHYRVEGWLSFLTDPPLKNLYKMMVKYENVQKLIMEVRG